MTEQLKQLEHRYEELTAQLTAPETYADPQLVTRLNREQRELQPVVDQIRAMRSVQQERLETESLLCDSDAEVRSMAREELPNLMHREAELERQLTALLQPADPDDDKNAIVEVRSGAGGEEAALFAGSLCRMYLMYAQKRGWKVEAVSENLTELGGVKKSVFLISGANVYARLKYESGVHRVQRVPSTESGGRIHTSTVTVAVLPEVDEVAFELNMDEVRIDTFRSSGAGGQHINKTESAIRVTHLPTGMVVECQDERSQYKNKDRALSILRAQLYEQQRQERENARSEQRRSLVGSGMRNERIRTYNFPQGRVTDHRISLTLHQIEDVLNGELDTILDALAAADRAQQMEQMGEEANQ